MPPRKKRKTAKLKKDIKEKDSKSEVTQEKEKDLTSQPPPLEDMPLHMKELSEEPEISQLGITDKKEDLIPSGFDMAEPIKKVVDLGLPRHFNCNGRLHSHGSDGRGYWWECALCRSQFYFRSLRQRGIIGNPKEAYTNYKVDSRPKKGRRLT